MPLLMGPVVTARPVGELLDRLGVTAELADADTVEGALVLLRVTGPGRPARAVVASSAGLAGLDRSGLLAEAAEL